MIINDTRANVNLHCILLGIHTTFISKIFHILLFVILENSELREGIANACSRKYHSSAPINACHQNCNSHKNKQAYKLKFSAKQIDLFGIYLFIFIFIFQRISAFFHFLTLQPNSLLNFGWPSRTQILVIRLHCNLTSNILLSLSDDSLFVDP